MYAIRKKEIIQRSKEEVEKLHQYNLKVKILSRLVRVAKEVYVYALTGDHDGVYIKVSKKELIEKIERYADNFDQNKFRFDYIEDSANEENNWQPQKALYVN